MKALGIGARVWVGWCADNRASEEARRCRLQKGIIAGGPHQHGMRTDGGFCRGVVWEVDFDNGSQAFVVERLITPIDDDGEVAKMNDECEVTA